MAMSGLFARLNCREYKNWTKAGQCLLLLQNPLYRYIDREMQAFHQQLASEVTAPRHKRRCQCKATGKQFQPSCPVCAQWKELILAHHNNRNGDIYWGNSDPSLWPTHYWEVAKVYMPRGQAKKSHKECDTAALLNLINSCNYFRVSNISSVRQMIKCRNELMHSFDMKASSPWLKDFAQKMSDLIREFTYVPGLVKEGEKMQEVLSLDWNSKDSGMYEVDGTPIVQFEGPSVTKDTSLSPYDVEIILIQQMIQELYLEIEEQGSLTKESQDKVSKMKDFLSQNEDLNYVFQGNLEGLDILRNNYVPLNAGWSHTHRFALFFTVCSMVVLTAFFLGRTH